MSFKAASAVLIVALAATGPVKAQTLDLSAIKCKEFTELPKETITAITIWLDGYYTEEDDPTVVELDRLSAKADRLAAYCTQNSQMGLMTAAENVMEK